MAISLKKYRRQRKAPTGGNGFVAPTGSDKPYRALANVGQQIAQTSAQVANTYFTYKEKERQAQEAITKIEAKNAFELAEEIRVAGYEGRTDYDNWGTPEPYTDDAGNFFEADPTIVEYSTALTKIGEDFRIEGNDKWNQELEILIDANLRKAVVLADIAGGKALSAKAKELVSADFNQAISAGNGDLALSINETAFNNNIFSNEEYLENQILARPASQQSQLNFEAANNPKETIEILKADVANEKQETRTYNLIKTDVLIGKLNELEGIEADTDSQIMGELYTKYYEYIKDPALASQNGLTIDTLLLDVDKVSENPKYAQQALVLREKIIKKREDNTAEDDGLLSPLELGNLFIELAQYDPSQGLMVRADLRNRINLISDTNDRRAAEKILNDSIDSKPQSPLFETAMESLNAVVRATDIYTPSFAGGATVSEKIKNAQIAVARARPEIFRFLQDHPNDAVGLNNLMDEFLKPIKDQITNTALQEKYSYGVRFVGDVMVLPPEPPEAEIVINQMIDLVEEIEPSEEPEIKTYDYFDLARGVTNAI